jgi:hypothetical protein
MERGEVTCLSVLQRTLMTADRPLEAAYVVTLVHGTRVFPWDKFHPDWTLNNSPLCVDLKSKLQAVIRVFSWTGGNSMRARSQASKGLADFLRAGVSEYPGATHFVIAHSHGGNVALRSICATDLEKHIQGIVCMATPFLHLHPNQGLDFGMILVLGVFYLAIPFLGALTFLVGMLALLGNIKALEEWAGAIAPFVIFGTLALFLWLFNAGSKPLKGITNRVERICLANSWPNITTKLLIIRSVADEASGVLTAMQFLRWGFRTLEMIADAPGRILQSLFVIPEFSNWLRFGLFILISGASSFALMLSLFFRIKHPLSLGAVIVAAVIAAWISGFLTLVVGHAPALVRLVGLALRVCLTGLATILLGVPLSLASALIISTFGPDLFWYFPWLDISVEMTPPGTWSVCLLAPVGAPTGLRHSVYNDPRAVSLITKWLVER